MSAHLLNARTLHDLAPGILDVVHGPDGGFETAPMWRGPLYGPAYGYTPGWWYVEGFEDGDFVLAGDATAGTYMLDYDLRVETVRARFARLCTRALGQDVAMVCYHSPDDGWWYLMPVGDEGGAIFWLEGCQDEADFVAKMTLSLAPKIAALGGSR